MEQQRLHKRQRRQPQPPSQQQQQKQQQPGAEPDATNHDPSRVWLPEVVHHFSRFLGGNELACTLRLVNKATAAQFRGPQHTTIRLSVLVPYHAFAWRWGGTDATRNLTVRQRKQLPCLTARSGSIANLEVLLARLDLTSPLDAAVLEAAVSAGQLEVCRWLRQQGCPWGRLVLHAAAKAGHKAVCEWLLDEGRVVDDWTAAAAARGGHVSLMDWLLARTAVIQELNHVCRLLEAVAASCDLPTLQRLHHTYLDSRGEELPGHVREQVLAAAASSPTADWRDKVEWLEGRGYPRSDLACEEAAARDDGRDRLGWLQQRGYPISADVACEAAEHGNVGALEFLLAQGVQLSEGAAHNVAYGAAYGGHLAALKVLHAHGALVTHLAVTAAAEAAANGHLPVVMWLVETLGTAMELKAGVYVDAARSGSWELQVWLHQHGCPWNASAFQSAAIAGSEEQLEWLVEHGCPMGDNGQPYLRALENADLAVLRCLRRLGCPWGPAGRIFNSAVEACGRTAPGVCAPMLRKQQLLALTWLVEQGCPVDWAEAERQVKRRGDDEVAAWVVECLEWLAMPVTNAGGGLPVEYPGT
ncbi:Ankyrin repeat domain-containing protein [Tetrabaena socialis]|uniref:Ankyrin repeat domain-containing protein n=1 Tax=Tetrabaena socialis TaxID=47790 RepID=A0A2J7ZSR7_9CHLO|nr:Ankyrin repeat domain-containing protein [Tetrabaena socialis]|eukprot:PNH03314.1 Ankyrin repeat domain-containing protein [Tetrabaena socialis]